MSCDNRRCLCCYGGCGAGCDKCIQGYKCQCLKYRPCCGQMKPPCCSVCPFNEWRKLVLGVQTPQQPQVFQVPQQAQPIQHSPTFNPMQFTQSPPTINQQAYYNRLSYTNMNTIPANFRR